MGRLCKAVPKKERRRWVQLTLGTSTRKELSSRWEVCRVTLTKENKKPLRSPAALRGGSWSSWLISSVVSCLPLLRQHCSWRCISSPGRWLQLWWCHWWWLFRLLALAGAVGKMNMQGLSAPSSITICQTFIYKVTKQRKCWGRWQQSLGPVWFKILLHSGSSHGIRGQEGGAQMSSFHLGSENLSGWWIKKLSGKGQQVLKTGVTLKNQRNQWREQRWQDNPHLAQNHPAG